MPAIYLRNVYAADLHGSEFQAVIVLVQFPNRPRPSIVATLNVRTGFGDSSRNVTLDDIPDDLALIASVALRGEMPRAVFADALQEAGCDDGITATVRGK